MEKLDMTRIAAIAAGTLTALLLAATAQAEPVLYSWTGPGINTQGSTKCPGYKMTIDITVDGDSIKGRFQQEGRPERHFETKRDPKGMIKTKAELGQGNTIEVIGTINDKEQKILLDGYCKFDAAKLTKK
jgi:hypothetical protein